MSLSEVTELIFVGGNYVLKSGGGEEWKTRLLAKCLTRDTCAQYPLETKMRLGGLKITWRRFQESLLVNWIRANDQLVKSDWTLDSHQAAC